MPERAFISIGSNIEPERHIVLGIRQLSELGRLMAVSKVYENAALGPPGQPDFLNAAALVETDLLPDAVRKNLTEMEDKLGRTRSDDRFAARTIDLDLCLYGDFVSRSERPAIPHPDILKRAYLAVTLAELDPQFRHPVTDERLADLAERLRPGANLLERPDVRPKQPRQI